MNFSFLWILVVCGLYITSVFYGLVILEYIGVALVNLNAISDTFNPTYEIKDPCGVCSKNNCKRHKLLPHSTKVKIPKDFDHALEQVNQTKLITLLHFLVDIHQQSHLMNVSINAILCNRTRILKEEYILKIHN